MTLANLLHIIPSDSGNEVFEDILSRPGLRVERIVSRGHTTP
jgi:cupin 2 domain-containing protein